MLSTSVPSPIPGGDEVEEGADELEQQLTIADEYPDLRTAMSREEWSTFERLVKWARQLDVGKRIEERRRIYGRGQPQGYNNQPVLTFACFHRSGTAVKNQWLCRIPISAAPLTIILPKKYLGSRCDEAEISLGDDANFCPRSVDDFLSDPGNISALRA